MKDWKNELIASKIDPAIIDLNFQYLKGDAALERLLYALDDHARTNTGKLRTFYLNRYSHCLNGGWWCSGVDLLSLEESDWGCFKPQEPRDRKYENPPDAGMGLFALKVPDAIAKRIGKRYNADLSGANFWADIIADGTIPIIITEGAKKAAAILSAGYCAVALGGISSGYIGGSTRSLIPPLAALATQNRQIIFAFDQDAKYKTRQAVKLNLQITGKLIEGTGCSAWVMQWPATDGKGADDILANKGEPYFYSCYRNKVSLTEALIDSSEKCRRLDEGELLELLNLEFADRLRFNELTSEIEMDGKPFNPSDELRFWFAQEYRVKVPKADLYDSFVFVAKQKSYHPVVEYLHRIEKEVKPIAIDNLAARYLGTTDPLYDTFLRKILIASVARALDNGCKSDCALILQGEQGQGKSTFFKILGGQWFNDSCKDIEQKDALQILHRCWIQELGEFERVTTKKAAGVVKDFLSVNEDMFRKPYAREPITYKRGFTVVGSVNKSSFLIDETGNRRFWVIPLPEKPFRIPIDLVREERDAIWAGAIAAYRDGEIWYLTPEEDDLLAINNEAFMVDDTWEQVTDDFCQWRSHVTVKEILLEAFHLEIAQHGKAEQSRVAAVLTRLGWKKKRMTLDGRRDVFWFSPSAFKEVCEKAVSPVSPVSMACPEPILSDTPQKSCVNNLIPVSANGKPSGIADTPPLTQVKGTAQSCVSPNPLQGNGSGVSDTGDTGDTAFSQTQKKRKASKHGSRDRAQILREISYWAEARELTREALQQMSRENLGKGSSDEMNDTELHEFLALLKAGA